MGKIRKFSLLLLLLIFIIMNLTPAAFSATASNKHRATGFQFTDSDKAEVNKHVKSFKFKKRVKADTSFDTLKSTYLQSTSLGTSNEILLNADTAPADVDWSSTMPTPGDQGSQGSCIGWSMAYAYRSYQEQVQRSWGLDTTNHQFSPSYVYNQINGGVDGGGSPVTAANLLVSQGCDTLDDMPYVNSDYLTKPTAAQKNRASYFKSASWASVNVNNVETRVNNLKAALTNSPLQAGVYVYWGTGWDSSGDIEAVDISTGYLGGGHSICLVGYDDSYVTADGTGAFKFINSWGTGWGHSGYGWMSYEYVESQLIEAIAITDITSDPVLDAYSMSGIVKKSDGNAVSGVTLTFSKRSGSGNLPSSVTSNSSGVWTQSEFENDTTYRITPSLPGYKFSPEYIDVNSSDSSSSSQDFIATVVYTASGQLGLCEGMGTAYPSTTMTFTRLSGTGSLPAAVTINSNGTWSQAGFEQGTIYRATPSASGYEFSPAFIDFSSSDDISLFSYVLTTPTISLTAPAAGSSWTRGTSQAIKWSKSGSVGTINIQLLSGGTVIQTIAAQIDSSNSTYTWAIPATLATGSYQIKLVSTADITVNDTSSIFSVAASAPATPSGLKITSINDRQVSLAWTQNNESDLQGYYVAYMPTGGSWKGQYTNSNSAIITGLSNDTLYIFKVKAVNTSDLSSAYSSALTATPKTIALTAVSTLNISKPEAGATIITETKQVISWSYTGTINKVNVQLLNNNEIYKNIASVKASKKKYTWRIPSTIANGTYQIRIVSTADNSIYGISDTFTISAPLTEITLVNPNGETAWASGASQTIKWKYEGKISKVNIQLLKGGVLSKNIASVSANKKSYKWAVPENLEDETYQIKIINASNSEVYDISDSIAIAAPPVTLELKSPNTGAAWKLTKKQTIKWNYSGSPGSVTVSLYKDGLLIKEIGTYACKKSKTSGSCKYKPPASLDVGSDYTIVIRSTNKPDVFVTSGEFIIQ